MLDSEIIQKRLARYFKLSVWATHKWVHMIDDNGNTTESLNVELAWYATIRYYYSSRFDPLVLAVMKTDKWRKGLLLIPPIVEPFDREHGGPEILQPVEIEDEYDRVSKNLESLNLVYQKEFSRLGGGICHFNLNVMTNLLSTNIVVSDCGDNIKDPSHRRLWLALQDLVNYLRRAYRHKEISKYVWEKTDFT